MAADEAPAAPAAGGSAVYIVYTFAPEGVEPEEHHLRTLAAVVGGEEAARAALLYSYKAAASGFSARLTEAQAEEMARRPDVLQVVQSRTLQLHSPGGGGGASRLAM